jgi:hypothetical protein
MRAVLVILGRAIVDRDLLRKWWLTPLLLAASGAFIYAQRVLYPPRKCVLVLDFALHHHAYSSSLP